MPGSTRHAVGLYCLGCCRGSVAVWLEQLGVLEHCVARGAIVAEALDGLTAIGTWCLDSSAALSTQELYSLMATSAQHLDDSMPPSAW